jgi:hypothetical protein
LTNDGLFAILGKVKDKQIKNERKRLIMEKTKKVLCWLIVHSVMAGLLVAGTLYNVKGALNVGLCMVWFWGLCSLFYSFIFQEAIKPFLADSQFAPVMPCWLVIAFDSSLTLLLIWHGHFFSGLLYGCRVVIVKGLFDELRLMKKTYKISPKFQDIMAGTE